MMTMMRLLIYLLREAAYSRFCKLEKTLPYDHGAEEILAEAEEAYAALDSCL
jgi:hypothetical protein